MEEELSSIINAVGINCTIITDKGFNTHVGFYNSHELILILSGIGKVNAALHTQYLIDEYKPDCVINVGVAGGLSDDLDFGDVVIAEDLVHHDMDITHFGVPLGQIPRMDVFSFASDQKLLNIAKNISHDGFKAVVGRIASGDQFIDSAKDANYIRDTFNAIACEMEGVAVAHVCHVNQLPFLVVRALSDKAGSDGGVAIHSFNELKDMSAARASLVVKALLTNI
jgi:adenosylhomocysteine nucleosidase